MQNHVTFETALRLKEAGFPQPNPEVGQFWYLPMLGSINGENPPYCINFVGEEHIYFSRVGGIVTEREHVGNRLSVSTFLKAATFAPTAADILRELKRVVGEHIEVQETYENEFVVRLFEDLPFGNFDTILETNDNPAEAAAQAFLNSKAKQ